MLEDGVDVAPIGGDPGNVFPFQQDATGGRLLESGDHAKCRRLAATGGTEHREELAPRDLEIGIVYGDIVAEPLDHVVNGDDRIHGALSTSE